MVTAEYQVRAITGDEFIVIYTRGSATVKACLARFLRMFNSSKDESVAGLDFEYTTVLESKKIIKEAEKKKPARSRFAYITCAWSTTYAMPTLSARIFRTSSRTKE